MTRRFWLISLCYWTALAVFAAAPATRAPYLQEMTSRSVLIAWRTAHSTLESVEVEQALNSAMREPSAIQTFSDQAPTSHHAITIDHLSPNRTYEYRILEARVPVTGWVSFKTFPEGNTPFSFAVLGDSGTASRAQKEVAAQMLKSRPDLVIHTGDVIYDGKTDDDYDKKFFSIYGSLLEHVPVFPSLGNHDTAWDNGDPFLENFYLPQNSPGKGEYYSFNCANAHFVALDSDRSVRFGSPQYQWLAQDLKESFEPVKIVYFHYPLYSSGFHGSFQRLREVLAPLFLRYHVCLVFNGHDHDYERSKAIHGITYVVTGGGGAALYPPGEESWTAVSAAIHHFVLGKVNGRRVHLEAINASGEIFDKAEISAP